MLVLTDGGGYELGEGEIEVAASDAPIWMVHLGGFPLGYDDATLAAIQSSGGGATGSMEDALKRLAAARMVTDSALQTTTDIVDGYRWSVIEGDDEIGAALLSLSETEPSDSPFAALAARRLILDQMQRRRADLAQLDVLDHLHAIAQEQSIVTPYSSMIVLVQKRQEQLLDELEGQDDRFQREHEDVGETLPGNNPLVTGVPEPEEWLLLALAVGMLGWSAFSWRRKSQTVGAGEA